MQPIYKGHDKNKTDPPSYTGTYLNDTLAKLFEGLLLARLTTHTELNDISPLTNLAPNPAHRLMTLFHFHHTIQQVYTPETYICGFR